MGRGGKVTFKRAAGRKSYGGDDEDDEEYVAEEEGSSYESGSSIEKSLDGSDANNSTSSSEEKPYTRVKSRRGYASGRRRSKVSDEDEWEDEAYDDDEDFSPDDSDEDDWEEDSPVLGDIGIFSMQGATKKGRTELKRKISRTKVNKGLRKVAAAPGKRKQRRMSTSSDGEDNFIVNGRSSMKSQRKDTKRVSKGMVKSISTKKNASSIDAYSFDSDNLTSDDDPLLNVRVSANSSRNKKKGNYRRRKKISKEDSKTSDSDFVVSDEESLDNGCMELARPRNSSKRKTKDARISKKKLLVKFKCTDSNDEISKEEVNGLEIERDLNMRKHERMSDGKKGKGKEKEADDLSKQLCGICLSEEHEGSIQGSLNCCSHFFCFACIMEWSKVESRCPLCKRRFVTITKSSRSNPMLQMRKHVIRVQMRDQVYQPSEEELRVLLDPYEDVVCMECHQGGDDSLMLLCDICDSSAHTYCVGLGQEVPEGNWYCDCCKLAGEGSLHSRDTRGANNSLMAHCGVDENGSNHQSSSILQRSVSSQGQSSSPGSDLYAPPPRNYMEDAVSASQASGVLASTLYDRRAASQRVRIVFSNRARQLYAVPNRTDIALNTEAVHSVLEQNGEQFHSSGRPSSLNGALSREQQPESSRDFPHSDSNLVQNMSNNEINFRHVNGAKKQVRSMVKRYLKKLPMEIPLGRSTSKKMVRKATNTILASCGIHHSRSAVSSVIEPPKDCSHDFDGGPVNLATGCCPSCFCDYVKNVVQMLTDTSS